MSTVVALLSSRKFWVGSLTVGATAGAVVLVALGKIPSDALVPTIASITATGLTVIGAIAWEDAAAKRAAGALHPAMKLASKVDGAPANEGSGSSSSSS